MKHFEESRNLLNNSNCFYIIATGMDGNYSYVNAHYGKKFPHLNPLVGQPYHVTMHPDDMKTCAEVAQKCFEKPGELFPATIRKHDGKGGYVFTQWEYKAFFDGDGAPEGIFCLGYDITTYEMEKQLRSKAETEVGNKTMLLKEIAYRQSHLIRAPLSNIIGLATVLTQSEADNNITNSCTLILESARQLDVAICDIGGLAYSSDGSS